ncbi:MAG: PKD domain-containing protein [Thermoplasmatales archaeon]|nr:MAG: PKD domain-containing protein [Thermoplasmatales archaeon]
MTKKITYILISMLIISTFSVAISSTRSSINLISEGTDQVYSHTVFAGIITAQVCGPCHNWSQNVYNTYVSGDYDFEYASMIVFDELGNVLNRDAENWSNSYGFSSTPTSILDGDYQRIVGDNLPQLPGVINLCGNRTVTNITANITVSWLGNGTINVSIIIQNNELVQYNGTIQAFITEISSRYNTSLGVPYHLGFLDFAFDENISIDAGTSYINSTIWNGNDHEDEHGNNFGDIFPNNIQVTMVVYNNSNGYVDETKIGHIPNNPPYAPSDPYPANGSTGVDVNIDMSWVGGDPDLGDIVTYDVCFGTVYPPPKVVNNQSATAYDPGTLDVNSTYYWRIIAWDNYDTSSSGPIWWFTTRINDPPKIPEQPSGPANGAVGFEYAFSSKTTDPDNDQVFYKWDWGDGNFSEWLGPYFQGINTTANHIWVAGGDYEIKVKAKDIYYAESNWSEPFSIHIAEPLIEIGNITGGLFKVNAIIKNIGDGNAENISWNINLLGGLILRGYQTSGLIPNIPPGDQVTVRSNLILGMGRTDVTVNAKIPSGPINIKNTNAFVFLFFIKA